MFSVALDEGHEMEINLKSENALNSFSQSYLATLTYYLPFRAKTLHFEIIFHILFTILSVICQTVCLLSLCLSLCQNMMQVFVTFTKVTVHKKYKKRD
jgi:hypothetical protein